MIKRLTIHRVDTVSAGLVFGSVNLAIGILCGLILGGSLMIEASVQPRNRPEAGLGVLFASLAMIVAPVGFGVVGFVLGLLMAMIHNLLSRYLGGLVLEVEDDVEGDEDD